MVAQGRGGSKTPDRVVALIREAVEKNSQVVVASGIGITRLTVQNYMKGIGEPSQATLQKLAEYFGVSVAWLRGGDVGPLDRLLEGFKIAGIDSTVYNKTIADKTGKDLNYWGRLIGCIEENNQSVIGTMCGVFGINKTWVVTGHMPTVLPKGEIVGTTVEASELLMWPGHYDVYTKLLSQDEVLFSIALDKDLTLGSESAESVLDAAKSILNMSEDLQKSFNQKFLEEVKNMALQVIKKYSPN